MDIQSVYIHVPFCIHRCGYCNFTLIADRQDLVPSYLLALESEFQTQLREPCAVETIFIGGGTPTYLNPSQLEALLELVCNWFSLHEDAEFSVECNPADCSEEKLRVLKSAGVSRISLGGQSFSRRKLKLLERDHTAEQLFTSIQTACEKFPSVSLDLIFGTPNETLEEWKHDLDSALSLPIQHLSTYGLTIEKGSGFFGRVASSTLKELHSEDQLDQYNYTIDRLEEVGWEHYEVSNFCLPGHRCKHNERYWRGEPWFAFGPGAANLLPSDAGFKRSVNHRSTTTYIRRQLAGENVVAEQDHLSREQMLREKFVFGLRKMEGVDLRELSAFYGNSARDNLGASVRSLFEPYLTEYLDHALLELQGTRVRLTRKGLMVSDSLWPNLLGEL